MYCVVMYLVPELGSVSDMVEKLAHRPAVLSNIDVRNFFFDHSHVPEGTPAKGSTCSIRS